MDSRKIKKHQVYMSMAHDIAELATCDRKHVGAVILKDDRLVSGGYNGSISGTPHCDEEGHLMHDDHCKRTIHAEQNAVLHADREELKGATMYVTCRPCIDCFVIIGNSGIDKVNFDEDYEHATDPQVRELADQAEIDLNQIDDLI
jgi:dCMP deaminase